MSNHALELTVGDPLAMVLDTLRHVNEADESLAAAAAGLNTLLVLRLLVPSLAPRRPCNIAIKLVDRMHGNRWAKATLRGREASSVKRHLEHPGEVRAEKRQDSMPAVPMCVVVCGQLEALDRPLEACVAQLLEHHVGGVVPGDALHGYTRRRRPLWRNCEPRLRCEEDHRHQGRH